MQSRFFFPRGITGGQSHVHCRCGQNFIWIFICTVRYVCHVLTKTEKPRQLLEKKLRDIKFYKHLFNGPTITHGRTDGRTERFW
jgi:hypothetical protein